MSTKTIRIVVEIRDGDISFAVCDNTDNSIELEVYGLKLDKDTIDDKPIPVALDPHMTTHLLDGCPKCQAKVTGSTCTTCNSFGCAECDGLGYLHCNDCLDQKRIFNESPRT